MTTDAWTRCTVTAQNYSWTIARSAVNSLCTWTTVNLYFQVTICNINQDKIDKTYVKIKKKLSANGLQVNDSKTHLTEFMTHQKRTKTGGIPPDLTVRELTVDKHRVLKMEDNLISDSIYCRMLGINLQNNLSWGAHLTAGQDTTPPGRAENDWHAVTN